VVPVVVVTIAIATILVPMSRDCHGHGDRDRAPRGRDDSRLILGGPTKYTGRLQALYSWQCLRQCSHDPAARADRSAPSAPAEPPPPEPRPAAARKTTCGGGRLPSTTRPYTPGTISPVIVALTLTLCACARGTTPPGPPRLQHETNRSHKLSPQDVIVRTPGAHYANPCRVNQPEVPRRRELIAPL